MRIFNTKHHKNYFIKTKIIIYILSLCFAQHISKSATCTAIASTNWTTTSTWSCGRVPLCSDDVVIPAGFTVTITTDVNMQTGLCSVENTIITISGVLFMSGNTSRLQLPAASTITINTGGLLKTNITNNSQKIIIGNGSAEWDSNTGNLTGPWRITNNSSVSTLPIELIDFYAKCQTTDVELTWITATEKNNDYFIVERSRDAQNWQEVTKISGIGNSSSLSHYIYNDTEVNSENNILYYRLSQVDFDGTKKTFNLIDVKCENSVNGELIIYPNPASNEINILLNVKEEFRNCTLYLVDKLGATVFESNLDVFSGINQFNFPIDLVNGMYSAQIIMDKEQLPCQKIVVLKP